MREAGFGRFLSEIQKKGIAKWLNLCYNKPVSEGGRSTSYIGMSPSGKAPDFDSGIRRFESCHPSHFKSHTVR